MRFYWNLRAEDAPTLVKGATQLLNDDQIPFRLKVVNDPAHYDRCDAGVLYVQRADYEQVLPAVRRILVELGANLKKATPVFTKVLAPGLGLAEEPAVSGDSFGMDRCRLLAEAIVRIHERAVAGATDRLAVIEEVFAEDGISLATPYLNLEASVRSRGAGGEGRPSRDLIEAGLSEPAGWRARLWRLCLRRRVRGAPSAETGEHLDGLIAIGEGDCGRQIRVGNVALDAATALLAQLRIRAVPANATIRTGATGVRRRMSGAAEPSVPHEVSSQNDERAGVARIRMPRMTMVPPQLGHRSGLCTAGVSGSCSADGAGDGAASRLRHSTRLAAR